jgi:hypothetical protein
MKGNRPRGQAAARWGLRNSRHGAEPTDAPGYAAAKPTFGIFNQTTSGGPGNWVVEPSCGIVDDHGRL